MVFTGCPIFTAMVSINCSQMCTTNQISRKNVFPLSHHQSLLLVMSSTFFFASSLYAFLFRAYFLCATAFITALVSINYWRHALPGIRKTIDVVVARTSFAIFFITGCWFVRDFLLLVVGWSLFPFIVYFYYMSNLKWDEDSSSWVYFHNLFHLCVALEQIIVILGSFAL